MKAHPLDPMHRRAYAFLLAALILGMVLVALEPETTVQGQEVAQGDGHDWGTPVDASSLLPTGPQGRHFRVLLQVDPSGMDGARDLPAQAVLDLASVLPEHTGYPGAATGGLAGFRLDPDSFILREVDADGTLLGEDYLPVSVERGDITGDGEFHAQREPVVTLRWIMPGVTEGPRFFHAYFDSEQNDPGPAPSPTPQQELALATSIGPGRGTTLFIPLQTLHGAQGAPSEPRRVHVTALHDDTTIEFYEYAPSGLPRSDPAQVVTLAAAGDDGEYRLGNAGAIGSQGGVLVLATKPVLAEARSVSQATRASFVSNDFIPSADGGFVGALYRATPPASATWHVFCPTFTATNGDCNVQVTGATPAGELQITANNTRSLQTQAGQPVTLETRDGSLILVHRAGEGVAFWPAVDGPRSATQYIGHAGTSDWFVTTADQGNTWVSVRSLGSDQRLCRENSPWTLNAGPTVGVLDQVSCTSARHDTGGLILHSFRNTPIGFTSGPDERAANLVVPQSPDGGYTYQVYVPGEPDAGLGRIVVYALYPDTSVEANRDGGPTMQASDLRAFERRDLDVGRGLWTLEATRPVVVAWLYPGLGSNQEFGAFAPGFASVDATVVDADYAGYALQATLQGSRIHQGEAGQRVAFNVDVTNLARDVAGTPLADVVEAHLRTPGEGWDPTIDLSRRPLDPDGSTTFSMTVRIPDLPAGSGRTITAQFTSEGNKGHVVEQTVQVSVFVRRGVELREAEGFLEHRIEPGETAGYDVRVVNRGSAPDSFQVHLTCPLQDSGWEQTITPVWDDPALPAQPCEDGFMTPTIPEGGEARLFLDLQAFEETRSREVTRVIATSQGDRSVTTDIRLTSQIGAEREFRLLVDEPTRTVDPGEGTTFVLRIANDADETAQFGVNVSSSLPPGWSPAALEWLDGDADENNTISIPGRSDATLAITRSVPEDAPALALAIDRVRVRVDDAPPTDAVLRVLASTLRGVSVDVEGPAHAIDPSQEASFRVLLESTGNVNQTIQIRPVLPEGAWSAIGMDDQAPPWQVPLAAFGQAEFPVEIQPDPLTPPGVDAARVAFEITGTGFTAKHVDFLLEVEERRGVAAEGGTVRLDPGRLNEVPVLIHNTGNVEADLGAHWDGLPEWDVTTERLTLAPGQRGTMTTLLWVPPHATADDGFAASMDLLHGSSLLATAEWEFTVNAPRLEAVIEEIRPLAGDQARYTVRVANTGSDAARNVTVLLDHETEGTLDSFLFLQIRPGASGVAALLGPADPAGISVRVIADHDTNGLRVTPVDVEREERGLPGPAMGLIVSIFFLLAALGAASAHKRNGSTTSAARDTNKRTTPEKRWIG